MHAPVHARPTQAAIDLAVSELVGLFGNRVATSLAVRTEHASNTTWIAPQPADAVIFPQSEEDVQTIVRTCAKHGVPVIPFGAGTSVEGAVNAPLGGICVDLKDMNQLLTIHAADLDCVVQPGLTRKALNEMLRDQGLFFPIDPGADASLGGMASTRASGTTAVRYGTMKDNVLALRVVLPNGEIIKTSQRAKKSSAGYDLTRLIVGAEGTLGIITELTLKLHGIPEAVSAGVCAFPSVRNACDAAITAIQTGVPMARVELVDETQVRVCNAYTKQSMPEHSMLFVEFNGTASAVAEQSESFAQIAREFGSEEFKWSKDAEERSKLWKLRHDVYWALTAYRPGARVVVTDVCVPISRLAECVTETKDEALSLGIELPVVGHVGDGNFHATLFVMMDEPEDVARARSFIDKLAERAIGMEGTCTGEHGIGQGKMRYMTLEHGSGCVATMQAIKRSIDPQNIMNPGKIF